MGKVVLLDYIIGCMSLLKLNGFILKLHSETVLLRILIRQQKTADFLKNFCMFFCMFMIAYLQLPYQVLRWLCVFVSVLGMETSASEL